MNNKIAIAILCLIFMLLPNLSWANSQSETTITADELIIDDLNSQIIAKGNVEVKRDELSIVADNLVSKLDISEVILKDNVIVKSANNRMSGDELILNNSTNSGVLTGKPKLTKDTWIITGTRFEFDLEQQQLIIQDNVLLLDDSQNLEARAERLEFDQQQQEIILIGAVQAKKGSQQINAERVTIDLKSNKMIAKGKTKLVIPSQKKGE